MWEKHFFTVVGSKQSFTLFLAPVAWGKTRLILQFIEQFPGRYLYISPLRALAQEFYAKASAISPSFFLDGEADGGKWRSFLAGERGVMVLTAERLRPQFIFDLKKEERVLILLDEFHLFYRWGEEFRPKLWQCFLDLAATDQPILGLTATVNDELNFFCSVFLPLGFAQSFLLNLGNHQLLYPPQKMYHYPQWCAHAFRQALLDQLLIKKDGSVLYFCRYRSEVDKLKKYFTQKGMKVLACKGGEAQFFVEELRLCPEPDLIVATSALSHGVNLPPLSAVFLSYAEGDQDFWTQMVGRGGRRGESYDLFLLGQSFVTPTFSDLLRTWLYHCRRRLAGEVVDSIRLLLGKPKHANQGRRAHSQQNSA